MSCMQINACFPIQVHIQIPVHIHILLHVYICIGVYLQVSRLWGIGSCEVVGATTSEDKGAGTVAKPRLAPGRGGETVAK